MIIILLVSISGITGQDAPEYAYQRRERQISTGGKRKELEIAKAALENHHKENHTK
jgi:hypothetical protein